MFTSITAVDTNTDEKVPTSSAPWVWVGFIFAGAFFFLGTVLFFLELEEQVIMLPLSLIALIGYIYWMICIHRIHKILAELTRDRYTISPGEAALKHIIPFYNLFWIFRWPAELSDYLNRKGRVSIISGYLIGAMLLLSLLLRFFDGAVGLAALFGVTMYVSAKLKKHVKAVKGLTPDQLPPLPDPRIFSRPIESSSTAAAPETAEVP